jgi:hypothetical protein
VKLDSAPASSNPVLSPGQWEALLHHAPQPIKQLVPLLAVHHGAILRPTPEQCPLCGGRRDEFGRAG